MIGDPGYAYVLPGRLAQGSDPPLEGLPFNLLVLCAMEHQTPSRKTPTVLAPLDDSGPPPTRRHISTAIWAADIVTRHVRRGERVLVVCHAGYNRSGLVTALTLLNLGASASSAIRQVRTDSRTERALEPTFLPGDSHARNATLAERSALTYEAATWIRCRTSYARAVTLGMD